MNNGTVVGRLRMKDMRIALISHEFPPYMFGGISSNCYDLANSLSKKGINITVFAGKARKKTIERINEHFEIVRLPYLDLPPRFIWFQLQNFGVFANMLAEYDVVHGVNPLCSAIIVLLKKRLRRPFVVSIHEVYSRDMSVFMNSPLSAWSIADFYMNVLGYPLNELQVDCCLQASDHIVACGTTTRDDMYKEYPKLVRDSISVIYNGINFAKVSSSKSDIINDHSITFFGRLVWRKGLFYLMEATSMLLAKFPDLTLHVFGKGPLEGKVRKMSRKYGMAPHVIIHGGVPYEDLMRNVRESAIVALPSLYEVGPFIAALEAMACRKPVVLFDYPFAREFVSDMKTGILAEPGNAKDLAAKLELLLLRQDLRENLANNAYDYVRRNHDWDVLADSYVKIYRNLME